MRTIEPDTAPVPFESRTMAEQQTPQEPYQESAPAPQQESLRQTVPQQASRPQPAQQTVRPQSAQQPIRYEQPQRRSAPPKTPQITMPRWAFIILIAVIIALAAAVVILAVTSCSQREETEEEPETSVTTSWVNPYNWDNLATEANGLHTYSIDGVVVSEAGVDVSAYDGVVDWEAVAASGIDFAMVRVGFRGYGSAGSMNLDEYFFDNIQGAKDAGLKVGAYFFSQAITEEEAIEEAQFVIDYLAEAGVELDYPVAFDEEPITNGDIARTDGLSNEQFTANALAYCSTIESAGYTAIIYGNQYDLSKFDLTGALGDYDVWLAEYAAYPTAQTDFIMWQYTENGTVDGIPETEGWVDLNIRFIAE